MNNLLRSFTDELRSLLDSWLPQLSSDWWERHVLAVLTFQQQDRITMKVAKRFVLAFPYRGKDGMITSHLATVFWLLSGMASCFIREPTGASTLRVIAQGQYPCKNHCIFRGGACAMSVKQARIVDLSGLDLAALLLLAG